MCLCCQHHLCSHFQTTISCGRNSSSPSFFAQKWSEASQDVDAQKSDPGCSGSTGLFFTHKGTVFRILKQQVWYIPCTHPPRSLLERAEQADLEPLCHEGRMKSTLHESPHFGPLPYWLWLKRVVGLQPCLQENAGGPSPQTLGGWEETQKLLSLLRSPHHNL